MPWTGAPAVSRATASRPATSSARCAGSPACGTTTRRARCRWSRRCATGSRGTCRAPPRPCPGPQAGVRAPPPSARLSAATRKPGCMTREELTARYEELSGRSVSKLNWYQALAMWKAAVFMEGNFKRYTLGASDDPYLALFDEGVPALAEKAREVALAG